jgi:hypothetical protein
MAMPDGTALASPCPPSRARRSYFFTIVELKRCRAIRAPD